MTRSDRFFSSGSEAPAVESDKQVRAALKIKSAWRMRSAVKRYNLHSVQLPMDALQSYMTFVIGNDPVIPQEILKKYQCHNGKIAIVAASGMRVLKLACMLGNQAKIPKIILLDNSRQVCLFWKHFKLWVENDMSAASETEFLKALPTFLYDHTQYYRQLHRNTSLKDEEYAKYEEQSISGYFEALFKNYGYSFVRSLVLHATVIQNSWEDTAVFHKLQSIFKMLEIKHLYLYPSNIVADMRNENDATKVLQNIEMMNPTLTIHTDLCVTHGKPERVFPMTQQNPTQVKAALFSVSPCDQNTFQETGLSSCNALRERTEEVRRKSKL